MFEDLLILEDVLMIGLVETHASVYDFSFRSFLSTHSVHRPLGNPMSAVLRVGPIADYEEWAKELRAYGVTPINDGAEHIRASELSAWYPSLDGLTPRSRVFETLPTAREVGEEFGWPVFVKGDRQTSRHSKTKSVIEDASQFTDLVERVWMSDPILHWQNLVVRQFALLRSVEGGRPEEIRPSFEFRAFAWRGEMAGIGRYWQDAAAYSLTPSEHDECQRLVEQVAKTLRVPFLVVDLAMTLEGTWIVIEVNDGQESGYAGVAPLPLWQRIIDIEGRRKTSQEWTGAAKKCVYRRAVHPGGTGLYLAAQVLNVCQQDEQFARRS